MCSEIAKTNGSIIKFAAKDFQTDVLFIMEIAKENLRIINFVSDEMKNELSEMKEFKDLILEAAKNTDMFQEIAKTNEFVMMHAPENLKTNVPFIMEIAKENLRIINYVSDEVKNELSGIKEFKDFILKASKDTDILRDLQIVSLDLSNMNINNKDLTTLSQKLKDNTNIRQINLEFNQITNQGLLYLQVFLLQTRDMTGDYNIPNLRLLRLGGNFLGENAEFLIPDIIRQRHMDIELLPLNPKSKVLYSKIEEKFKLNTDAKDLEKYLTQHFSLQELTLFVKEGGILSHFKANKEKYRKIYSDVSDKDFKDIFNFGEDLKQKKQIQYDNEPTSSSSSTSRTILQQRQIQYENEPTSSSSSMSHSTSQNLNTMKDVTSSSLKTINPKTKEEMIEILIYQYNKVLEILSKLNMKAIENNVQTEIQKIKQRNSDITEEDIKDLKQIFYKNLQNRKHLYFRRGEKEEDDLLEKYEKKQYTDEYTYEPIRDLVVSKDNLYIIDQKTRNENPDISGNVYTLDELLQKLEPQNSNQNRYQSIRLKKILDRFKDFYQTKLLQKKKQQVKKTKEKQEYQQKMGQEEPSPQHVRIKTQITQIQEKLTRMRERQLQFLEGLPNVKEELKKELIEAEKEGEEIQLLRKRSEQLENKNQLTQEEINEKITLTEKIEELIKIQNTISQIQKLLKKQQPQSVNQQLEHGVRTQK